MIVKLNQYGVIDYYMGGKSVLLPVKFVHFFEHEVLAIVALSPTLINKYKDCEHIKINNVANKFYHSTIVDTCEDLLSAQAICFYHKED